MQISINGKIVDQENAKISIFDRAYLFGEGLFETCRSYGENIPFLDRHLKRLEWSSTFVGIPFPHPHEIKKVVFETLKASQYQNARIKIILSGLNQTAAATLPPDMSVNLVVICEKYISYPLEDYENGVEITILRTTTNDVAPLSSIKSVNWLTKMLALREIAEKECFDGIFLNHQGYVTETSKANLFWVKDKKIKTAPVNAGLLPGITREVILELIKKEGFEMGEELIRPDDLKKVSEIFITNSVMEVMPVVAIDGTSIGEGVPGPITQEISHLYSQSLG